mmetsp:Transcript_120352/g.340533  ORF Transcript_120352/g.340533 Transcript_120352/m.340533 type:complete len:222 (+) Transcript_120352:755-1420(+)
MQCAGPGNPYQALAAVPSSGGYMRTFGQCKSLSRRSAGRTPAKPNLAHAVMVLPRGHGSISIRRGSTGRSSGARFRCKHPRRRGPRSQQSLPARWSGSHPTSAATSQGRLHSRRCHCRKDRLSVSVPPRQHRGTPRGSASTSILHGRNGNPNRLRFVSDEELAWTCIRRANLGVPTPTRLATTLSPDCAWNASWRRIPETLTWLHMETVLAKLHDSISSQR